MPVSPGYQWPTNTHLLPRPPLPASTPSSSAPPEPHRQAHLEASGGERRGHDAAGLHCTVIKVKCVCGVLVRAGGGSGSRALEHPLCPPPPRGQGTPPLETAAILGKEVAWSPGGSGGGRARRGGLRAPQPLGATGGRAGAGRTGARRPRRLGEGCARVPWFCLELFGVTCRLLPLSPGFPLGWKVGAGGGERSGW